MVMFTVVGCGGGDGVDLVPVEGTVTLDGQPLPDAWVTFSPELGRPSSGKTDSEGRYRLQYTPDARGAVPGKHHVTISTFVEPDSDSSDSEKQAGKPERIPEKFNKKTTLTVDLVAGKREPRDFALTSE